MLLLHLYLTLSSRKCSSGSCRVWFPCTDVQCSTFKTFSWSVHIIYGEGSKLAQFLYALTLRNINRFSKLFRYQNQEKFVIILSLKMPPHLKYVLHNLVKCPYLKSNNLKHWSVASPAWVRRPAARRTHWTFDVKPAGCDSYFRH